MRPVIHLDHNALPESPMRGTHVRRLVAAPVVRYGFILSNHNETVVAAPAGLAIKTQLKAGLGGTNHNETVVAAPAGLAAPPECP